MGLAAERGPEANDWPRRDGLYSGFRLFVIALVFVLASPLFWHRTQLHDSAVAAAYENSDLYQDIYPSFKYAFERIRAGQLPAWNAKILCGTPCLANPNVGAFQPLHIAFAFRETGQAMADHGFRCLVLMGVGMVLFGRAMGLGYLARRGRRRDVRLLRGLRRRDPASGPSRACWRGRRFFFGACANPRGAAVRSPAPGCRG